MFLAWTQRSHCLDEQECLWTDIGRRNLDVEHTTHIKLNRLAQTIISKLVTTLHFNRGLHVDYRICFDRIQFPYPRIHSVVCSFTLRSFHGWSSVFHEFASSAPSGMRVVRERETFSNVPFRRLRWTSGRVRARTVSGAFSWCFLPFATSPPVRPKEDHFSTPGDLVFQCPMQYLCHHVFSWCGVVSSGVASSVPVPLQGI